MQFNVILRHCVYVCVCVCVRERERERDIHTQKRVCVYGISTFVGYLTPNSFLYK